MSEPRTANDVSELPDMAFGHRDPLFWGLVAMMAIEGMVFAFLVVSYFYIRENVDVWPPSPIGKGTIPLGAGVTALLLLSCIPTHLINRNATGGSLKGMRFWLIIVSAFGVAAIALRAVELAQLPFRWNSNAYGSIFWTTLGLHCVHLISGVIENLLVAAVFFIGPVERKHLVDAHASGFYWYFVVGSWLFLFPILYLDPVLW